MKRTCTPQDIADVIVFLCVGTSMINGQATRCLRVGQHGAEAGS
ncbi:MAG TPA: hypothetical protein VGD78_18465 [Chthoniobacterales bacterium]